MALERGTFFISSSPSSSFSALISCRPVKISPHTAPAFPPSYLVRRGSSIRGHRLSVEAPPFISSSCCRGSEKATESIVCIKKAVWLSAVSREGGSGGEEDEESPCQPEKWNFIWMNRRSVQREWGKEKNPVSPPVELMTKSRRLESMEEVKRGGVCFCARRHVVKKKEKKESPLLFESEKKPCFGKM